MSHLDYNTRTQDTHEISSGSGGLGGLLVVVVILGFIMLLASFGTNPEESGGGEGATGAGAESSASGTSTMPSAGTMPAGE
ncbi:hypothetical protein M8756_00700 [Lutimaribacter sp. EGI FJ00015]|uniref:Uncharacterized protein n=1 Tax=Lutimaribacter degradans TaxID=2945989 RepID=A0ACC5ZT72_9RHOB|nr:hypothetical protein [Lutimaribacter sp. EGI FJ00013]MCM2561241.1 hypothetical protein [Lutimaribacter sp. EGI FJ00013]MCO0611810.1 hypothetical protein [Lutimaribacter sp. EGI FJ00015]MCO0635069.1 hypothetical protein [Lutimaribacter sp. EGI FJ00014]